MIKSDNSKSIEQIEVKRNRNLSDDIYPAGIIEIQHIRNGEIMDIRKICNLITSAGKAGVASRINGSGAEAAFTYLAVGIGTTAAAIGNTTLESEITDSGLARAAATCTRVTTTVANDTAQLVYSWSVTGSKAVTECGILNAASAGTLLGRQVFAAINVVNLDTLQITYKVQAS